MRYMDLKLAKVVTNKILADIDEWKNRLLCEIYPIIFIDAVHFSVIVDSVVKKLAAYVVLGNADGIKEVLSLEIGENESSKFLLLVYCSPV